MKSKFVKAGIIVAGFWCGATAMGQDKPTLPQSQSGGGVYQSRFDQAFAEPNDGRIIQVQCAPACAAPANCGPAAACGPAACGPAAGGPNGCGPMAGCNGGQGCNGAGCEDKPWALVSIFDDGCGGNSLLDKGWTIGGWTSIGYQNNPDGAFTGNGGFLDDREWDKLNLNQQYLFLERKAVSEHGCWAWGARGDIMYGVDGNEGQAFGNNPGRFDFQNGFDHGIYEWAFPQLYAELAKDKFSVKLGRFFTPTGYEVFPPAGNFFYSHQILWYNGEAFYHTGALATYVVDEKLTISGGYFLGWDTGFDQLNGGSEMSFNMAYNFTDKTSLAYFGANGNQGWRGQGGLNGLILSHKWTDKVMTVSQFDVFVSDNPVNFNVDAVPQDDVSFVQYAFYEFDPKWKAGVRYEWYEADETSYNTLTFGVNYKPNANLVIRPEVRHNWAPGVMGGAPGTIAANMQEVYGDNTIFGIDAVLTY